MTRLINTRSGSAWIDRDPIPRAKLKGYLDAAARDAHSRYTSCPWWRPIRRAYLRGLSDALYDACMTHRETERYEAKRYQPRPTPWRTGS